MDQLLFSTCKEPGQRGEACRDCGGKGLDFLGADARPEVATGWLGSQPWNVQEKGEEADSGNVMGEISISNHFYIYTGTTHISI